MNRDGRVRSTSLAAYRAIQANGRLKKWAKENYDILYFHGPLTTKEMLQRVVNKYQNSKYNFVANYQKAIYSLIKIRLSLVSFYD